MFETDVFPSFDDDTIELFAGRFDEFSRTLSGRERQILSILIAHALDPFEKIKRTAESESLLTEEEREVLNSLKGRSKVHEE